MCVFDAHHALTRDLLDRGIHCLVEKPITASVEEAEELIALAEAAIALDRADLARVTERELEGVQELVLGLPWAPSFAASDSLSRLAAFRGDDADAQRWREVSRQKYAALGAPAEGLVDAVARVAHDDRAVGVGDSQRGHEERGRRVGAPAQLAALAGRNLLDADRRQPARLRDDTGWPGRQAHLALSAQSAIPTVMTAIVYA